MTRALRLLIVPSALFLGACPEKPGTSPVEPPAPPVTVVEPDPFTPEPAPVFPHAPPGELLPNTANGHRSIGVPDETVYAETMRFPIEEGPAFSNSQIFNPGGNGYGASYPGPGGEENVGFNFDYPWRDDFCEVRDRENSACDGGQGHQGQDVRAPTCRVDTYWIVAPERVQISQIGDNYLIKLYGLETGNTYRLLHMDVKKLSATILAKARDGTPLERGERIAKVSNLLTPDTTTTHLHFELKMGVLRGGVSKVDYVPPYTSLIEAYLDLIALNPEQAQPAAQPVGPDAVACKAAP